MTVPAEVGGRTEKYGVLTPTRLVLWIGILVLTSMAVATAIGFIGAKHGVGFQHFDWSLAAVAGTAVGTVLLAGFTGALAWTTSGDVRATIRLADATQEEQRARNRPIVAVRMIEVVEVLLDPAIRETVPTLRLWIKNVGLGPALDLRLHATYAGAAVPTEEVIAVVEVSEVIADRPISLAAVAEPLGGFVLEDFVVTGECTDRTRTQSYPIVILAEAGLPDQVREAQQAAAQKAWLALTPGNYERRCEEVSYQSQLTNRGPADAKNVRLQLIDDAGTDYGDQLIVGTIRARGQTPVTVVCRFPHARLSCRLTWEDGRGPTSWVVDGAYQPFGLTMRS